MADTTRLSECNNERQQHKQREYVRVCMNNNLHCYRSSLRDAQALFNEFPTLKRGQRMSEIRKCIEQLEHAQVILVKDGWRTALDSITMPQLRAWVDHMRDLSNKPAAVAHLITD